MITLHIEQQFGRLGLDITPFKYDLNIKAPDLKIKQTPAQMDIGKKPLQIDIDYTAARESIGYYALTKFMKVHAEKGMEESFQGIARRAKEGDALGDIEKGITLGQIARQRHEPREVEVQITPIAPLKYYVTLGQINCQVELGGVDVYLNRGEVNAIFGYGKVKAYLEQEPRLEIKAIGNVIDEKK